MSSDPEDALALARRKHMLRHERRLWTAGVSRVAGIDEAGRGPLAGPVVAAAVIVEPSFFLPEVDDSKKLSAAHREALFDQILSGAVGVGVGMVDNMVIDEINILNATMLAMHRAVDNLPAAPEHLLVDGNRFTDEISPCHGRITSGAGTDLDAGPLSGRRGIPFTTIVRGDSLSFSIAAASIIAKVTRDRLMNGFDEQFPGYGFCHNKGYATRYHREAIARLGFCPIHRRTFHVERQLEMTL